MSNDGGFDAAEAAPPQDAGPLDDPCPGSSTVNVNCSNLCQPTDTKICNALVNCSPVTSAEATVKKLPFRIRLPANPALTCGCKIEDGSAGPLQYTLWFAVPGSVSQQLRAIVKAPWYVREIWTPENDACVDDKFSFWRAGCTNLLPTSQYNWIGVGTNDPNAPSRVLTVSSATAATSCSDYYWK